MRFLNMFLAIASFLSIGGTAKAASIASADVQCARDFLGKNYVAAFAVCDAAAKIQPSYLNQVNLGVMRLYGWGTKRDVGAAIRFFETATQLGNWDGTAEHNLAYAYDTGTFVQRDAAKAVMLYRRAAQSGHEGSQYNLGIAYLEGTGVPISYAEGYAWLLVARQSGSKEAQAALEQLIGQISAEDKAKGKSKAMDLLKSLPPSRDERIKRLQVEIKTLSE